jgi:hypothetical protein
MNSARKYRCIVQICSYVHRKQYAKICNCYFTPTTMHRRSWSMNELVTRREKEIDGSVKSTLRRSALSLLSFFWLIKDKNETEPFLCSVE